MFGVFFCGWIPIYIVAIIDWDGTSIPHVVLHGVLILPTGSLLINIVDLFWYNHELRSYFMGLLHNQLTRTQ